MNELERQTLFIGSPKIDMSLLQKLLMELNTFLKHQTFQIVTKKSELKFGIHQVTENF